MNSALILAVAAVLIAVFTKPDAGRFESYINESLDKAKIEKAQKEQFIDALVLAGVGALKNGEYHDYVVASKFRLMFLGKPVTTCYGFFGQVSCGHGD